MLFKEYDVKEVERLKNKYKGREVYIDRLDKWLTYEEIYKILTDRDLSLCLTYYRNTKSWGFGSFWGEASNKAIEVYTLIESVKSEVERWKNEEN